MRKGGLIDAHLSSQIPRLEVVHVKAILSGLLRRLVLLHDRHAPATDVLAAGSGSAPTARLVAVHLLLRLLLLLGAPAAVVLWLLLLRLLAPSTWLCLRLRLGLRHRLSRLRLLRETIKKKKVRHSLVLVPVAQKQPTYISSKDSGGAFEYNW